MKNNYSRKEFLTEFVKICRETLFRSETAEPQNTYIKLPGIESLAHFFNYCNKCYQCVSACQHEAIQVCHDKNSRFDSYPVIEPEIQPCFICSEFPCVKACPTGALQMDHIQKPLGYAKLNPINCLTYYDSFCQSCINNCPRTNKAIYSDSNGHPTIDIIECYGCGICQHVCPATPSGIQVYISDTK